MKQEAKYYLSPWLLHLELEVSGLKGTLRDNTPNMDVVLHSSPNGTLTLF